MIFIPPIFAIIFSITFFFVWEVTKDKIYLKLIAVIWIVLIGLFVLGTIRNFLRDKKILERKDFNGEYIIDRSYFPGKETDWQYNRYRFDIRKNDSIYFHVTEKEKILETFNGTVSTFKVYHSERLVINMDQPTIHILRTHPTIFREAWSFYLVFNSSRFGNMFFSKEK